MSVILQMTDNPNISPPVRSTYTSFVTFKLQELKKLTTSPTSYYHEYNRAIRRGHSHILSIIIRDSEGHLLHTFNSEQTPHVYLTLDNVISASKKSSNYQKLVNHLMNPSPLPENGMRINYYHFTKTII